MAYLLKLKKYSLEIATYKINHRYTNSQHQTSPNQSINHSPPVALFPPDTAAPLTVNISIGLSSAGPIGTTGEEDEDCFLEEVDLVGPEVYDK